MRVIRLWRAGDAAQLRQELAAAGLSQVTVSDPDAKGDISVTVPEEVDGPAVDLALQRHFPRALVAAIAAVDFEGVDFDAPTTLAGLKAALNQHKQRCIELRNRTARALRARWE